MTWLFYGIRMQRTVETEEALFAKVYLRSPLSAKLKITAIIISNSSIAKCFSGTFDQTKICELLALAKVYNNIKRYIA